MDGWIEWMDDGVVVKSELRVEDPIQGTLEPHDLRRRVHTCR